MKTTRKKYTYQDRKIDVKTLPNGKKIWENPTKINAR